MLRAIMAEHGLSERKAAKQVGISVSTMSRLLNGKIPDITTFALVVKWLEMDASLFFTCSTDEGMTNEQEQWARLVFCLADLGMNKEFIDALVAVVKLINRKTKV